MSKIKKLLRFGVDRHEVARAAATLRNTGLVQGGIKPT
jgi:hypothetical protein